MVMTIVIMGVIAGIAAVIIMQGIGVYSAEESRSEVHYQARLAMQRMTREIRTIRSPVEAYTAVAGTLVNPGSGIIFTDVTGTTITFSRTGTVLNRINGGTTSPLAQGVTALTFNHYDDTGTLTTTPANLWTIEIAMTAQQGGETLQMRTRVHPRNF